MEERGGEEVEAAEARRDFGCSTIQQQRRVYCTVQHTGCTVQDTGFDVTIV